MAMVLAEIAEAGEAEEASTASKGFKSDSQESAQSKGVSPLEIAGSAMSLASSILSLVSSINRGKEETQDILERRYAAGLLRPSENRNSLINQGLIPSYYSTSNIKYLLSQGILPYGWSDIVASSQGFANEVMAWLLRQRASNISRASDEKQKRELSASKALSVADKIERDAQTRKLINILNNSVV